MKAAPVLGVLMIVAGVVYALVYAGWLRRSRGRATAAGLLSDTAIEPASRPATENGDRPKPRPNLRPTDGAGGKPGKPRPLTLAWVEGTYVSTTQARVRPERGAAAGLSGRARATMVVDDSTVRWERVGTGDVRVAGPRLLGVSEERSMADRLPGRAHVVLVSWTAEDDSHDRYVTGFLPRRRADSAVLVSAVQRLMRISVPIDDVPTTLDGPL